MKNIVKKQEKVFTNVGKRISIKGITTYQIITGYYNKVVNLKALIPFFGMGLSFTRIYSSV